MQAHDGTQLQLRGLKGFGVFFCYPMTGKPGVPLPTNWDNIPGARGCTPQSCAYRDNLSRFAKHSATVYGVSTQQPSDQLEAANRLELKYRLLSDQKLQLAKYLRLPTFSVAGLTLLRRATFVTQNGKIVQSFYPIFPSDSDVPRVLEWLDASV